MKDIWKRSLSGLVFAVIVVSSVWFHEYSYAAVFIAVGIICILEFQQLTKNLCEFTRKVKVNSIISFLVLFGITFFIAKGILSPLHLMWIPVTLAIPFLIELFNKNPDPLIRPSVSLLIIGYVSVPVSMANFVAFSTGNGGEFNGNRLLAIILLTWILDIFAYLVGSNFGKRPLFPKISPKKSVEGLIGGAVACFLSTILLAKCFAMELTQNEWFILSLIVIVFGTLGDLVESMIKRKAKIKDSGSIMPGHGGMLDRFDALLFILPFAAIYILIFV